NKDYEEAKKYLSANDQFAVIARYKGKTIRIENPTQEDQFTSAIIRVTRENSKTIAFITGHQEKDIDSEQPDGLKVFADTLRADSFTVSKINLLQGDKLPDPQTGIIAIVGPKVEYLQQELDQIRDFLK